MIIEIDGTRHELPDDATEAEIQSMFGTPAADDSMAGRVNEASGQTLRMAGKAGFLGLTGLPGLAVDGITNAAYGAKKLASKTGLVDAPNPEFYYGKSGSYLPVTSGLAAAADEGADALGLPGPKNKAQEYVMGGGEAALGALTGSGVANAARNAPRAVGFLGRLLGAEPVIGAAAATAGSTAGRGAEDLAGDALPSWAPAAIGMATGVGVGTGASAARAFGGYVPGYGRVSTTSAAGQDAIANTITQRVATDPNAAARNLRGQTTLENAPGYVAPGYSELSTNAAQDTGLATAKQYFRDAAGGQIAERAQTNNVALTRAFEREGGAEGAEGRVRAQARAGTADLDRFGLTAAGVANNPEEVDITPFLQQLGRETDPTVPGTTASGRGATREIADNLRAVSRREELLNLNGEPTGEFNYYAIPERIQSARQDISESLAPARPGAVPTMPSVAAGRRQAGDIMGRFDNILTENTDAIPGPQGRPLTYPQYMARQRGLRNEADERGFMRALMEDAAPNTNPVTGAQEFKAPKLARLFNEKNTDRVIPGASKNMSIDRLTPARQSFLRDVEELGQLANFSNTAGTATAGSSTARNMMTEGGIANIIRQGRAPYEKVLDSASRVPIIGSVGRGAGYLYRLAKGEAASTAAQGVRSRLGQLETNRPAALEMLTGRQLPERGVGISARRQAARTGRYGVQSFLAAETGAEGARQSRRGRYGQ